MNPNALIIYLFFIFLCLKFHIGYSQRLLPLRWDGICLRLRVWGTRDLKFYFGSVKIIVKLLNSFVKTIVMNTVSEPVSVYSLEWNILVSVNFRYCFGNRFEITAKIYIYILLLLFYKIINLI